MSLPTSGRSSARVTNDDRLALARTAAGRDFADGSSRASRIRSTKAPYVTARRLAGLDRAMSDRDRAILTTLACVRVATARQLYYLHFEGVTRRQARASLASLSGRRVITRLPR